MDFSDIFRNPNREEGIRPIRQRISAEVIHLLGERKVIELSLNEALKLKELSDLADWHQNGMKIIHGLNDHIDSLYEIEAAGELVQALRVAYIRQSKLSRDIEELKSLLLETEQQIYREKQAERSFGRLIVGGSEKNLLIKRSEEGMKMMLEELNQKTEEKRILEQEISKLQLQIKKLKQEYLYLHLPREDNGSSFDKVLAWGIIKDRQLKLAQALENHTLSPVSRRKQWKTSREESSDRVLEGLTKKMQGSPAMRWAERIQGVNLPPPPPPLSAIPASAYNTVEKKALNALYTRESRNAAEKIFSKKLTKNKPTYGIPNVGTANVGTGFGGGYRKTRRRRYSRKRRNTHKK